MSDQPVDRGPAIDPAPGAPDRGVEAGRGALFIGAAKVFFMVTASLQKFLLTHVLGSADVGIFEIVNGWVSVVNNATVQGTIQWVSKFTAEDSRRAEAVKAAGLRLQLLLGPLVGLGFFLAAPIFAAIYKQPGYVRWFRLVALIPCLYSFYAVFVGSANGLRRFRAQAGFDMTFSTIKTVLLLGGAAAVGLAGAFGGFVVAAAIILVVAALVMGLPRKRDAGEVFPVRRLLASMTGIVLYTVLINFALSYDSFLLRRFTALVMTAERADQMAGYYSSIRNLALLPNSALLIVTFVIFPLVSRSTFQNDRAATTAYVTQTLRYAFILAVAMAVVIGSRPAGLMRVVYRPEYLVAAPALPILVGGIVCLSLLAVAGAILNAAGRSRVAVILVASTLAIGGAAAFVLVPAREPGPAMFPAAASATAFGMFVGLVAALVYLRRSFGGGLPLSTVARVAVAAVIASAVAHFTPGQGKVITLAALALAGVVFFVALVLLREFGAADRTKFRKVLRLG
jgi:O-antigen/teichoic acid export membrane protein